MPSSTLTVKYVNPPREGSKRGSIKTVDDEFYGVWPENIELFEPGVTYEVQYVERTTNGRTFRNVKSARPHVLQPAAQPAPSRVAKPVAAASPILTPAEWRLIVALRDMLATLKEI
jgi:hypothetical protein